MKESTLTSMSLSTSSIPPGRSDKALKIWAEFSSFNSSSSYKTEKKPRFNGFGILNKKKTHQRSVFYKTYLE